MEESVRSMATEDGVSSSPEIIALPEQIRLHSTLDPAGKDKALEAARKTLESLFYGAKRDAIRCMRALSVKLEQEASSISMSSHEEVRYITESIERLGAAVERLSRSEAVSRVAGGEGGVKSISVIFKREWEDKGGD